MTAVEQACRQSSLTLELKGSHQAGLDAVTYTGGARIGRATDEVRLEHKKEGNLE